MQTTGKIAANLHRAGKRAGVERIVVVSIIGCDRFTGGYGAAKVAHEQAMLAGPIPVSILRAAEFHEFVGQLVDWGTQDDVSYVPTMRTNFWHRRKANEAKQRIRAAAAKREPDATARALDAPAGSRPAPR